MIRARAFLIWIAFSVCVVTPIALSATSPLLAWREPIYILGGFAGILAMTILFVQPLFAIGFLPGLPLLRSRLIHRWTGAILVLAVAAHVFSLWVTSPPDLLDALLFRSPTWFSIWGVIAMWMVFATALLAVIHRSRRLSLRTWRTGHKLFAVSIVICTVLHVLQIEGTMEIISKIVLCALVLVATLKAIISK